jgi:uncharacterized iron-regulated membrane protein
VTGFVIWWGRRKKSVVPRVRKGIKKMQVTD